METKKDLNYVIMILKEVLITLRFEVDTKIYIIDVSQMRGEPALILSSLVLQKIFDHNQQQFTEAKPETIPTIAIVGEAQAVFGNLREIR